MAKDWIGRRNNEFREQAMAFSEKINADPAAYGIDPADAAQLAAAYTDFAAKLTTAEDPRTRTGLAILARKEARKILTDRMRDIGGRIRANQSISRVLKFNLGLSTFAPGDAARLSKPTSTPNLIVRSVVNNIIELRLIDEDTPSRLGKPRHITSAEVFTYTGDEPNPPQESSAWQRRGLTMSAKAKIVLPILPAGTKVWICARWFNTHGAGPVSRSIYTHLAGVFVFGAAA